MNPLELTARLEQKPLLMDGGMGSMLIREGLEAGRAPEWWVVQEPGRVQAVHRRYVDAGSDLVLTCTFGASPRKLESVGLAGRCREVNQRGVEIARAAARGGALVAGDMGPTGRSLPPVGTASLAEIEDDYHQQATALAEAGADLLVLETLYDRREALAGLRAARATGLPVLVFMTFDSRPRGFFTLMGDPLLSALRELEATGADGVGMNCSVDAATMRHMVETLSGHGLKRLMAQPASKKDKGVFRASVSAPVGACGRGDGFRSDQRRAIRRWRPEEPVRAGFDVAPDSGWAGFRAG